MGIGRCRDDSQSFATIDLSSPRRRESLSSSLEDIGSAPAPGGRVPHAVVAIIWRSACTADRPDDQRTRIGFFEFSDGGIEIE